MQNCFEHSCELVCIRGYPLFGVAMTIHQRKRPKVDQPLISDKACLSEAEGCPATNASTSDFHISLRFDHNFYCRKICMF